ncbi:MAG TPA: glycosyltransferase [Bryobacteraceae bacterium]|nr:glycosyltransferase [Bryobacteraceae bacterium]
MPASAYSLAIEEKAEAKKASAVWLQVAEHLDPRFGGIAGSVPLLAQAAESVARHFAPIAAFTGPEENLAHLEQRNLHVFRFPRGRSAWIRNPTWKSQLQNLIEAVDGVHIHGIWGEHCAMAAALAREAGKPYIVAAHGMLEGWALQQKRLKKMVYSALVERPNLQGAACLQALTRSEVDDYRQFHAHAPVAIIPNGVDVPVGATPDRFLEIWPQLKNKRLLLFLSRLHPKKGLDILCQTWSRLRRKYPDHHLVLAGPDFENARASTEELVDMLDMRDAVTFTGMLASGLKWSALAASELFVLPSYSEGFSMAVLEAMAMAVPVVITTPCHFPEVAEHGCGEVVEPDARQLEAALIRVLNASPSERQRMGRNGQDLILRRYTWETVGRQLTRIYDWLLGGQLPSSVEIYRTPGAHS